MDGDGGDDGDDETPGRPRLPRAISVSMDEGDAALNACIPTAKQVIDYIGYEGKEDGGGGGGGGGGTGGGTEGMVDAASNHSTQLQTGVVVAEADLDDDDVSVVEGEAVAAVMMTQGTQGMGGIGGVGGMGGGMGGAGGAGGHHGGPSPHSTARALRLGVLGEMDLSGLSDAETRILTHLTMEYLALAQQHHRQGGGHHMGMPGTGGRYGPHGGGGGGGGGGGRHDRPSFGGGGAVPPLALAVLMWRRRVTYNFVFLMFFFVCDLLLVARNDTGKGWFVGLVLITIMQVHADEIHTILWRQPVKSNL
jgi:hypothetical protein